VKKKNFYGKFELGRFFGGHYFGGPYKGTFFWLPPFFDDVVQGTMFKKHADWGF